MHHCAPCQVVSVTVQITTPDDIDSALQVEIWVPAGLEPMDPNVNMGSSSTVGQSGCGDTPNDDGFFDEGSDYYGDSPNFFEGPPRDYNGGRRARSSPAMHGHGWWWDCVQFDRETMADRVTYYAQRGMRAGTQTFSFEAVAATVGRFALPPAQALVVMQPEVMGLSVSFFFFHLTVAGSLRIVVDSVAANVMHTVVGDTDNDTRKIAGSHATNP